MRIAGRTAVVTGASSGIGRSTALLLARRGAHVVATGRNIERLAAVADAHERIRAIRADVSVDADRARLVEEAGAVDILVNNAGVGWAGTVASMPAADVRQLWETNLFGLVDLTQRVLPGMLERKRGHVSLIASVVGYVTIPPIGMYSATKFAVRGYGDALRRDLFGSGVTVTTINPGPVATRFLARAAVHDREEVQTIPAGVPPWLVAFAVERGIRASHLPGFGTITVPRALGLVRLADVPGIRALVDVWAGATSKMLHLAERSDR